MKITKQKQRNQFLFLVLCLILVFFLTLKTSQSTSNLGKVVWWLNETFSVKTSNDLTLIASLAGLPNYQDISTELSSVNTSSEVVGQGGSGPYAWVWIFNLPSDSNIFVGTNYMTTDKKTLLLFWYSLTTYDVLIGVLYTSTFLISNRVAVGSLYRRYIDTAKKYPGTGIYYTDVYNSGVCYDNVLYIPGGYIGTLSAYKSKYLKFDKKVSPSQRDVSCTLEGLDKLYQNTLGNSGMNVWWRNTTGYLKTTTSFIVLSSVTTTPPVQKPFTPTDTATFVDTNYISYDTSTIFIINYSGVIEGSVAVSDIWNNNDGICFNNIFYKYEIAMNIVHVVAKVENVYLKFNKKVSSLTGGDVLCTVEGITYLFIYLFYFSHHHLSKHVG